MTTGVSKKADDLLQRSKSAALGQNGPGTLLQRERAATVVRKFLDLAVAGQPDHALRSEVLKLWRRGFNLPERAVIDWSRHAGPCTPDERLLYLWDVGRRPSPMSFPIGIRRLHRPPSLRTMPTVRG